MAPTASAAAPARFYGVNWDREAAKSDASQFGPQFEGMRAAGVETTRVVFRWSEMQPTAESPVSFDRADAVVRAASTNGLQLLPVFLGTPQWAAKHPGRAGSPPRRDDAVRFFAQVVARYGERGTFWVEHPDLPLRPVRYWQIWNEPELASYWNEPKFWIGYAKLVRASDRALTRVDPSARIVLAGLTGFSWRSLEHLYDSGIKGHFDVAAIHPYTGSTDLVARVVRRIRRVLRHHGEPRKALWITELSWPASKGHMQAPSGLRRVVTDDRGMAKRLTSAYRYFVKQTELRHRVGRIYWYTWASTYQAADDVFDYSGLLRFTDAGIEQKPAFYAYRRIARRGG